MDLHHEDYSSFHVYLTSDVPTEGKYDNINTLSYFYTPLEHPIIFNEEDTWVVALEEISFPTTVYNISKESEAKFILVKYVRNEHTIINRPWYYRAKKIIVEV